MKRLCVCHVSSHPFSELDQFTSMNLGGMRTVMNVGSTFWTVKLLCPRLIGELFCFTGRSSYDILIKHYLVKKSKNKIKRVHG